MCSDGGKLSSDCFQYKMDVIFGPTEQCCNIADNLIVFGYSEEDYYRDLFVVLDMAKYVGLHFNPDKWIFCCTQIPFFVSQGRQFFGFISARHVSGRTNKWLVGKDFIILYFSCSSKVINSLIRNKLWKA